MDLQPTLPRRTWLERFSILLGVALVTVSALTIAGWCTHHEALLQPFPGRAPMRFNAALSFLLLGLVLLAVEFRGRRFAWLALVPVAIGIAALLQTLLKINLQFDEVFVRDHLAVDTDSPGRIAPLTALGLIVAGGTLAWQAFAASRRARRYVGAMAGSIVTAVAFSTLLGYASSLRAAYFWGTTAAVPPVSAIALFILGLAILLLAWRESVKDGAGAPVWSPLPVVVGCLTLTIVFWIGLRERERSFLNGKTQTALDSLATAVKRELDDQMNQLERLTRRWGDGPVNAPLAWEIDAKTQVAESARMGCTSLAIVSTAFRTQWIYPVANGAVIGFEHTTFPERREALEKSLVRKGPAVSATTSIVSAGKSPEKGFVVYVPLVRSGRAAGFVAAEYVYPVFFRNLIAQQPLLVGDYHVSVHVGSEAVFNSNPSFMAVAELSVDKTYVISERRVQLSFTPTKSALSNNSRSLPELALSAGFGITILLGLSVHFARSSRAGQRSAELSNAKLVGENEERRRVEARLKVSDERLRLALDSTQIGIFEWSVPAGSVYYSQGLWAMLGYDHGRMPSTVEAWQSLVHPDDLPLYRRRTESQLNGIASFIEPEYRVRARSGEWRWVYTRSKSVANGPNGRPIRIIGTVQDITARREAEHALRESQAEARKLSLVASRTDSPVLISSPNGNIEWVNEAFCRVMEYTLEEVLGKDPAHFMDGPEINVEQVAQIRDAMKEGRGISTDVVNYSKSGRKYYLHLEIQPVRRATGELENFIAIETDITARVETEQQLRRAKGEADAASRAKSDFLASMSHEIRTPMNGVIGMTSLLMGTPLNTDQRDFVHTIRNSGEALLTIINDILDFSKIESGKMEFESRPLDLATCLEDALDLFAMQASAKRLDLTYNLAPDVPPWIKGDVTRLRQVVVNLVNNAIKFTPSGGISLTVKALPGNQNDGSIMLEFAVNDTGIGISEEGVGRLFKAFSQVDSSTTRKYGGTGLGLAICQRLCQLMGGDVRVESVVGEGSTFFFTLKAEAAPSPPESALPPLPEALRGASVLCVEDHPVTQARLHGLFAAWGVVCHVAGDFATAASLLSRLPVPPKLLVIDGTETGTTSPLRVLPNLKCSRLVMFPFGQSAPINDTEDVLFAPVAKPLKQSAVIQAVTALFSPTGTVTVQKVAVEERPLAEEFPLDVLLAEDNPVNQKVALRFLERLGYRADAVGNGLEAVTTLENRRYDLVLMDLQMPEMDGLEASREIRRRLSPDRQPKIIALTANAMQGDRELCLDAGMDDYISKPVKLTEITAAIRRQFGHSNRAALDQPVSR
ncbi:MAG: response regulator [Opitutaceae bacterium]